MRAACMAFFGLVMHASAGTVAVTSKDGVDFVAAPLPSGLHSIHAEWLRERCLSPAFVDTDTNAPRFSPHEYPRASVVGATSEAGQLSIKFTDVSCEYSLARIDGELRNPVTDLVQVHAWPEVGLYHWDRSLVAPVVVDYAEWMSSDETQQYLYEMLFSSGHVLLQNAPKEAGQCELVGNKLSIMESTNFGGAFNVLAGGQADIDDPLKDQKDLAYTSGEIRFHSDAPWRESAPDVQLLHAIDQCECPEGGPVPCDTCHTHNFAVDSWHAAMLLFQENPAFFRILATVPVRFENNGGFNTTAIHTTWPHIELHTSARKLVYDPGFDKLTVADLSNFPCAWTSGDAGPSCIRQVRFSIKGGGYLAAKLPVDEMNLFYAAKRRFSEILHDPQNKLMLQLRKGDMWLFDNKRVLHARSAIPASDGRRWLQGCYLQVEEMYVRYEPLRRAAAARRSGRSATLAMPEGTFGSASDFVRLLTAAKQTSSLERGSPLDLSQHALQLATKAVRRGQGDDAAVGMLVCGLYRPGPSRKKLLEALKPYLDPAAMRLVMDAQGPCWERSDDEFYPSLHIGFFTPMIRTILQREPNQWSKREM